MSKEQIIADAKAALASGRDAIESQVLSDVADKSALEQKASDGTLGQGDLDAAVAAAVAPLNEQIAALQAQDAADVKAGQDAVAAVQSQVADVQSKLDLALKDKSADEAVIKGLQSSAAALKGLVDQLNAIVLP